MKKHYPIKILEQQHKARQSRAAFHTLTSKREELKSLFHTEQKQQAHIVAQSFYEWGNKPGRLLARSLQQRKSASFIAKIKNSSATIVHDTPNIAKEFRAFYQHLYHVQHSVTDRDDKTRFIREYLARANLPRLPPDTLASLEGELTTSELRTALKAMANGKAPGLDGFTVAYYRSFADILPTSLDLLCQRDPCWWWPPTRDYPCTYYCYTQTRQRSQQLWKLSPHFVIEYRCRIVRQNYRYYSAVDL